MKCIIYVRDAGWTRVAILTMANNSFCYYDIFGWHILHCQLETLNDKLWIHRVYELPPTKSSIFPLHKKSIERHLVGSMNCELSIHILGNILYMIVNKTEAKSEKKEFKKNRLWERTQFGAELCGFRQW